MKAEHRKELETNTLADRMGQVVQRVKTGQRRTFLIYAIIGAALVIVLWYVYVTYQEGRQQASQMWMLFDDGGNKNLELLAQKHLDTHAGKAACLQMAWYEYWEGGLKRLGAEPLGALQSLQRASQLYKLVADQTADDILFEPQALLGFALVEESKAVQHADSLDKAESAYKIVFEKKEGAYKDTAEGRFAKERYDQLKDPKKRAEIASIYDELRRGLGVRALDMLKDLQGLPKNHPKIDVGK